MAQCCIDLSNYNRSQPHSFQNSPIFIIYVKADFMISAITTSPLNNSQHQAIAMTAITNPFTALWYFSLKHRFFFFAPWTIYVQIIHGLPPHPPPLNIKPGAE
jgi:hypothetical protein